MKKQLLVGFSIATLVATGSFSLLRSVHAQQQGGAVPSVSATLRPATFEVRDKGVLINLIHAEGGRDKATNTLRNVTVFNFDTSGRVQRILRADSMEVQRQGDKTHWVFRSVNMDNLLPKQYHLQGKLVDMQMSIPLEEVKGGETATETAH